MKEDEILREVVSGYLSASSTGRLTKGFASLDTKTILVRTGATCPVLFRVLKTMQDRHWLILGQLDSAAVDVAVTASGLGRYATGPTT